MLATPTTRFLILALAFSASVLARTAWGQTPWRLGQSVSSSQPHVWHLDVRDRRVQARGRRIVQESYGREIRAVREPAWLETFADTSDREAQESGWQTLPSSTAVVVDQRHLIERYGDGGQAATFRRAGDVLPYSSDNRSGTRRPATGSLVPGELRGGHGIQIPEPLVFDLVRPLGARQGELEFNTLAIFPWRATNRNLATDPFGSGPSTPDRRGIEWAPEVEYAPVDNFAIEFEFPFEEHVLEEYKLGLQWTIGTGFDDHYIHGIQVLVEPSVEWRHWNTTLLYLGGVRFDETWSALFMLGGRMDLEGRDIASTFERITNASLFANLSENNIVGVETNFAAKMDGGGRFLVVPQWHAQLTDLLQIQSGLGFGVARQASEQSFVIRVIYSRH
jgi:hypothetical protein